MNLVERVESSEGCRDMPLPVQPSYALADLLPRRAEGLTYRIPGEIGPALARAFERSFALLERANGPIRVPASSKLLTPRWHRVLRHLVGRGLARTLTLSLPTLHGLPIWYFDIGAPFQSHLTDAGRPPNGRYARGFSDDYDHALAKVVGECLERGTLLHFRMSDFVRGSVRSLRSRRTRFLDPRELSIFSAAQRERRPELHLDDDTPLRWTRATSLVTEQEALVPAQLVYWTYPRDWGDVPEPLLREQNAHGAGAFYSLEGAILSGLCECIQRDGFFRHWLRRVAPPRIDPAGITRAATMRLVDAARELGLEPHFFDITSELGVPTCLCALMREDSEFPRIAMGASCRLDGDTAIHDALLEAASVHHVLARSIQRVCLSPDRDPLTDTSFGGTDARLAFWAEPDNAKHLSFFLEGSSETVADFRRGWRAPADAREALDLVIQVLRQHQLDAWWVPARHEALGELGFAVVRVITPGLLPMYCDDRNAPLGLARAEGVTAPAVPHPFP